MLTLSQAAAAIGYSESGMRKLIRRRAIRFFQLNKHSPIKFRQEWLDEFIESNSVPIGGPAAELVTPRKRKTPPLSSGAFGFDAALLA